MDSVILPGLSRYFWCCSFFVAQALTYIRYNKLWQPATIHAAAMQTASLVRGTHTAQVITLKVWNDAVRPIMPAPPGGSFHATACDFRQLNWALHAPLLCDSGRHSQIWVGDKRFDGREKSNERWGCIIRKADLKRLKRWCLKKSHWKLEIVIFQKVQLFTFWAEKSLLW